ncbi:M13 family metallopeptidase [Polaribacter glomeratus]|uniref:Peptidase M13 n=1 Tax=Polaribacter glomeratus TaxID=102 RepID=A0A2S7WWD6_9FLAO|nr:M13 family metallopeptidase [Polaribacter glomeratus]PQJ81867.1 peptidase M13 [Polaribacter glomeratus]TXD66208.1 M13 family metallopeptidase [Polaribacter glomeratus]
MKKTLYYTLLLAALASCTAVNNSSKSKIDFDGISENIKPGDNFFEHVNKVWLDSAVIADDQSGVGSYSFLNIPQKKLLENILTEVSAESYKIGSVEQMVGDFYSSGMDTVSINKRGFEPLQVTFNKIEAINSVASLITFVIGEMSSGNRSIISMYVAPDNENSKVNMLHFGQSGLGLPDRDYYFKTDEATVAVKNAYKKYLTTLFNLSAQKDAEKKAEIVYEIEKKLAASHKTRIERRDVKANYHKMDVAELSKSESNIGWTALLAQLNIKADSIDIAQPDYYKELNAMLASISMKDWKTYLKAHTLSTYDDVLSKPFETANFEYSKVLYGQDSQNTRAQLMVQKVDRLLGFALGQLYVKRHFNEDAKKRVLDLVNNLQKAFENRINQLDWMSDVTKKQAKEKLYTITKKIGYPDVWRTYTAEIKKDAYFENVVALYQNAYQYNIAKLNSPPNRDEWETTPATVTAYYNPPLNEIVFPAGILQFPYFDITADDAVNYGGIGMVIGHELTHAFDDQGAQFDKDGNVKNWWTADDYTKFKAKTQLMIDRYSSFTVLDSLHIKGALTVGENTADNGGIAIAYDAFKLTEQGKGDTKIQGYTPDQRFFLSIARIWRVKTRDAYLTNYIKTNSHSPPIWRVNGPLMNFDPFYEVFNVQPGDKNYKPTAERIKIW